MSVLQIRRRETALPLSAPLRAAWAALRSQHGRVTPNSDPERFCAVTESLGQAKPDVALFHIAERVCAAVIGRAALRRMPLRVGYLRARTPGLRCLDIVYGGLIVDGEPRSHALVLDYLDGLLADRSYDCVSINSLPMVHPLYEPLSERSGACTVRTVHRRLEMTPGSFEDTIRRFSKKHRYNMRRMDRVLREHVGGTLELRVFKEKDQVDDFVRHAGELTARTYHARLPAGFSGNSLWGTILSTEAGLGRMRCYTLAAGERPLAHIVGTLYGDTYHVEAMAFDPGLSQFSPGQVLLVRALQELCDVNVHWVDYGFGDAEYKRIYGSECWDEANLYVYSGRPKAWIARGMNVVATAASRALLWRVQSAGLIAPIKRRWPRWLQPRGSAPGQDANRDGKP